MLVTERAGRLRIIRNGVLDPQPVAGVPAVPRRMGLSGLMDVALHPRFAENHFVYLTYTKPLDETQTHAGARARTLDGQRAHRRARHLRRRRRAPAAPRASRSAATARSS